MAIKIVENLQTWKQNPNKKYKLKLHFIVNMFAELKIYPFGCH